MKVSKDFIVRDIAGEFILVPVGAAAVRFNGLITMNAVGQFLFQLLQEERTLEGLARSVTAEYDVSYETACADCEEFLQLLRQIGALVE